MPVREHRIDRLNLDELRPAAQTPEGYVFADLRIAKPGVLVYTRADGSQRRELVPESTLADPEWLASIASKPVTVEHPPVMVSPDNVGRYGKGLMGTHARYFGGFVTVSATITHRDALDAIRAGKVEVSPGYDVDLDPTPGEHPEFGRYDAVQVKRYCNHVAVTDRARGGADIVGRFDSADGLPLAVQLPSPPSAAPSPAPEVQMDPTLIAVAALLGVRRDSFKSDDEFKTAVTSAAGSATSAADKARTDAATDKARLDGELATLRTERDTLKTERDTLSGEKQALQVRVDAFESADKQRKDSAEKARLDSLAKVVGVDIAGLEARVARLKLAQSRVDALDDKTPDAVVEGVLAVIEKDAARTDGGSRGEDHRYDGWNQGGGNGGERRDNQGGGNGRHRRDSFWNPSTAASDEAFYGNGGAQ